MNSEFLMPQKYEGYGCGLSVSVCGLDDNIQYEKITIYLEGREQNKYVVDVDSTNSFKTMRVAFGGLKENIFYNVVAELVYNGETVKIQAKMVPSVNEVENISLFSLRLSNTETPRYLAGAKRPSIEEIRSRVIKEVVE